MGESDDSDITVVLLSFCALDKSQRDKFVDKLNEFVFVSRQQQNRLAKGWLESCRLSSNPAVNRVAESMAPYVLPARKRRKKR